MGYGGMGGAMAAKLGGKKKPSFMNDTSGSSGDDTGDNSVDAIGADEVADLDGPSMPVNESPEDELSIARGSKGGSGDSEPDIGDEGEGSELGTYDAVEDDAASELASLAGIAPDKAEAFKAALSDYVAACVRKQNTSKPAA